MCVQCPPQTRFTPHVDGTSEHESKDRANIGVIFGGSVVENTPVTFGSSVSTIFKRRRENKRQPADPLLDPLGYFRQLVPFQFAEFQFAERYP